MLTGIWQTILTLAVILVFYSLDTCYMSRYERERKAEGSSRSYSYTFMVAVMVAFLAAQPVFWPQLSLRIPGGAGLAVQIAGLALILAAIGLHIWSRVHLRQFYAERVEIQPSHQLIDTGPYAYVRHPVITSFFSFATGLLLINPSLFTLLVLAFTLWDFSRAARQEEKLLSLNLYGYDSYMRRTSAFFPRLFRTRKEQPVDHRP